MVAHEFDEDGFAYEKDGVVVTVFAVDHDDLIKPSYGYRIDCDGRAVVISGDTKLDKNRIKAAKGANLMVLEVELASLITRSHYDGPLIVGGDLMNFIVGGYGQRHQGWPLTPDCELAVVSVVWLKFRARSRLSEFIECHRSRGSRSRALRGGGWSYFARIGPHQRG